MLKVKAKLAPLLIWSLFAILVVFALVLWRSKVGHQLVVRSPGVTLEPGATQSGLPRIAQAAQMLAFLKQRESEGSGQFESTEPVIAIAPLDKQEKQDSPGVQAAARTVAPFSLILIESTRGIVAVLDGHTLRVGKTTNNGEVVHRIGRTFVDLTLASGETRRIDMKDRFMPRPVLPNQENFK